MPRIRLTSGDDVQSGTTEDDIILGGAGNDMLHGLSGNDHVHGEEGSNIVFGDDGDDKVIGGPVVDILYGGANTDRLYGIFGDDQLFGDDGDDMLIGGVGNDYCDGGVGGFDRASWYKNYVGVTVDLNDDGSAVATSENGDVDTLVNMEGLEGSYYNDRLFGNAGDNLIEALFGDDLLDGEGGNDWLEGKTGDDRIVGASGDDMLFGDGGFDTAAYSGLSAGYFISESDGAILEITDLDLSDGDDGVDRLTSVEYLEFRDQTLDLVFGQRRFPQVNGLEYIASNADLITAFGPDAIAGLKHFASTGQYEHRATDTFDVDRYLEKYEDLRNAFGDDTQSAIIHYISNGFAEGRTDELL